MAKHKISMKKFISGNPGTIFWSFLALLLTAIQFVYFLNYNRDLLLISFIPLISLLAFFWGYKLRRHK